MKITNIKGIKIADLQYSEHSRGVSHYGKIEMDGIFIGTVENKGYEIVSTVSILPDAREEFHKRMKEYMTENDMEVHQETFMEHLLDVYDFGKVLTEDEKNQL